VAEREQGGRDAGQRAADHGQEIDQGDPQRPFRHSLAMTLALAAAGNRPAAVPAQPEPAGLMA
jgi:hypothetical protein